MIVDEAHSSQTGEAAKDLKARPRRGVATRRELDGRRGSRPGGRGGARRPGEDVLARQVGGARPAAEPVASSRSRRRRRRGRWSCSARRDPATDSYAPFHLYSMRQAIEEGFILDVLANYTTYDDLLAGSRRRSATTPSTRRRRRGAAIARFVALHPHNLAQKAEIIVEHFREHTRAEDRRARRRRWSSPRQPPARRPLQAGASTATSTTRATPTCTRSSRSRAR